MGSGSAPTSAPVPADEPLRLHALRHLAVLDTPAEPAFDEFARLAALVCATPIGLISFVDGDREWFKAAHGFDVESVPRDVSLCSYTILEPDHFVVEDMHADARLAGHAVLAAYPDVRFYAGVPIHTPEPDEDGVTPSSAVGALCVVDVRPRRLSPEQLQALRIVARQTERLLSERLRARERADLVERRRTTWRRQRAVNDSMLSGLVVHAANGVIEGANPAAERILGLTVDQMRGLTPMHPDWQCIHADGSPFPGDEHPASIALRDRVAVHDVLMGVRRPDGDRRWLLVAAAPLPGQGGEPDGAVATFVDVTGEIDLRHRLSQSLELLERTTHEHAAVTAAISHDLAAPVATVRILADILSDAAEGVDRTRLVASLRSSAHRVEERLADLVTMATRFKGSRRPERTLNDVRALVVRGCAHADRPIAFGLPSDPVMADVDALQVERIVDNLVGNACKHTPPDCRITVTLTGGEHVTITVDDDGPGIPPGSRDAVFEPFHQLSADAGGDGIGLYLVRQFARFHDGDAWCEERPGGGGRFVVTLAATAAASTPPG